MKKLQGHTDFSYVNKVDKSGSKPKVRHMTRLGAVLKRYFEASTETQDAFAKRTGAPAPKLTRIQKNGDKPRPPMLTKIIRGLPVEMKVEALVAYLTDHLPEELIKLIEIRPANSGQRQQPVQLPPDELEIAMDRIRALAQTDRGFRSTVMEIAALSERLRNRH